MKIPQPGEYYYHYKHDPTQGVNNYTYQIMSIAVHSETEEVLVVYRPLYVSEWQNSHGADTTVRPLDMFNGQVEKDGQAIHRFTKITDPELIASILESQN